MEYETIDFEVTDSVATITLNRPDNANTLNKKMVEELFAVSIKCSTNKSIRSVILTGRGKLFCGGADLAVLSDMDGHGEAQILELATILHAAITRFSQMDAPLVVAVNGAAGGGGFSLALAGDYVIASDKAKFVSAYTASALTPDDSSTYFLAKHVGLLRAKELAMTNRVLSPDEALDWGLVNKVVPADELASKARKMAGVFATGPTKAFGGLKRLLQTAFSDTMETQLDKESVSVAAMMRTHDTPHAIASFPNKEKPNFKGE